MEISSRVMGVSPAIASKVYDELMPAFNPDREIQSQSAPDAAKSYVEMGILPAEPDMSKLVTEKFLPVSAAKGK